MKPFQVIGHYKWTPGRRYASIIGPELIAITRRLGFVPLKNNDIQKNDYAAYFNLHEHAQVRMTCEPQSQATQWHQDGDTTVSRAEMDFGLIVWASRDPTEFKAKGGQVYQATPFDIVYCNNLDCLHRRPPGLSGYRWHFRQRVVKKGNLSCP